MATVSTVPARRNDGPSRRGGPDGGGQPPLLTFRRVVRGVGKTLISAGVLLFLFVAYELWGTGLTERREQNALKHQFAKSLAAPPSPSAPPAEAETPVPGDALGVINIPKLGLEKYIVEGVGTEDLKKGPGHYPTTPLPGQAGNAAIAGHRTTYGAPFNRLDELGKGDPIVITTHQGKYRYEVDHSKVVPPSESSVLDNTPDNRLTLTTCNPKYSAAQRLIVVANLVGPVSPTPPAPPSPAPRLAAEKAGLSGKHTARAPAIAWGTLAALVWILAWWIGRRWRRWASYALATPVFLVVLFVFFENISRLLPANV